MEKVRKKLRSEWFDRLMSDEQILYIEHSIASFYGLQYSQQQLHVWHITNKQHYSKLSI